MQDHDVGRLDLVGRGGNIHEPTRHPISHPGPLQQCRRLRLVIPRDLQVRCLACAARQQLNLKVAHSAADLQYRGVLNAPLCQEGHHPELGVVEPALAIRACAPPGEPVVEDGLVARPVATVIHGLSVAPLLSQVTTAGCRVA